MTSQLKHWNHYETQLITYDVTAKNNGKVRDVRSLACKIKVLNGHVPGTWKWTIDKFFSRNTNLVVSIFMCLDLLLSKPSTWSPNLHDYNFWPNQQHDTSKRLHLYILLMKLKIWSSNINKCVSARIFWVFCLSRNILHILYKYYYLFGQLQTVYGNMAGLKNLWEARRSWAFHIFYKPAIFL